MTINQAIERADGLCANAFSEEEKCGWLGNIDAMLCRTLFMTEPVKYTYPDDGDKTLLVEDYEELYVLWLIAKIRFHSEEFSEYNNAANDFNHLLQDYRAWWQRTHTADSSKYANIF